MGAYEILVYGGSGFVLGYFAAIITLGGVPKLLGGDSSTRMRFAWFIGLLYAISLLAEILTDFHTPMPFHIIMGTTVGWIFGVENPLAQLAGVRSPPPPEDSDQ